MKFWKLLCAVGCVGFLLVLLLAYVAVGRTEGGPNNDDPTPPRPAPRIPVAN